MALKIRLARGGAKKRPFYQIVIADARAPRDGRFVEKVGTYNPMLPKDDENRIRLNGERIKHWLSVGAQPTDRVALFLGKAKMIEMPTIHETPQKSAPKAKTLERLKAKEDAVKEKTEAVAAAESETPAEPQKETPAEAAPEAEAPSSEALEAEAAAESAPEAETPTEAAPEAEAPAEVAPEVPAEPTPEPAEEKPAEPDSEKSA